MISRLKGQQPDQERTFSIDGPVTFSVKRDPIWDGAAIWGGIFGGLTALATYGGRYGSCERANPRTFCRDITISMTLASAGLGALIDRARDRSELRVVLRPPTGKPVVRFAPVVGPNRIGVALGMRF